MASIEDVTFSIYTAMKAFADSEGLEFYSTSSIENATNILREQVDRLILVQTHTKQEFFLDLYYAIFFSFSTTDINSIRFIELISKLIDTFPKYSKLCVYNADKLKEVPSIFEDTGVGMVVTDIKQKTASTTQMKDNLSMVELKLSGYIK